MSNAAFQVQSLVYFLTPAFQVDKDLQWNPLKDTPKLRTPH